MVISVIEVEADATLLSYSIRNFHGPITFLLRSIKEVYRVETTSIIIVALIAQLGERQTEDLKVLCSIHSQGILSFTNCHCRTVFLMQSTCNFVDEYFVVHFLHARIWSFFM